MFHLRAARASMVITGDALGILVTDGYDEGPQWRQREHVPATRSASRPRPNSAPPRSASGASGSWTPRWRWPPRAANEVIAVTRQMEKIFTRAMHDGQPSADDIAIARVIGDVWLSNLVAWVTRRASADDVSSHLELAARLLLR